MVGETYEKVNKFIDSNIKELCNELTEWRHMGILHNGEGGIFREAVKLFTDDYDFRSTDCFFLVEKMIIDKALHYVGNKEGDINNEL